jgi:4-amino-4-deoxy-L-arabinose transferase-like glycosyltransferase
MKSLNETIRDRFLPLLIFIASFIYFSSGNEKSAIFMVDEARNSECAREMSELGEMVVPTFNYELRTDKPPLHYWFMMLSYALFGVNEFAARFFSAVFGAVTLLLTFYTTRRYLGLKQALFAILIMLASLNIALEFHLAVPDPYFIFFMTAAHLTLFNFLATRNRVSLILTYVFTGLAVMTKGPVAIVLIGLSGLLYVIIKKELTWSKIRQLKLITGVMIVSAIAAPWFIRVGNATNWRWQQEFIFEHNLDRFIGEMEGHGGFFSLTIAYVFIAFLPFSVFIIQSYREVFRKWRKNDLLLFSTVSSLVIILFFSFSATKLPNYAMPAYPFTAIIIGSYFTMERTRRLNLLLIINLIISIAVSAGVYFATRLIPEISSLRNFSWLFILIPFSAVTALWIWSRYRYFKGVIIAISMGWIIASMISFLWLIPSLSRLDPVQQVLPTIDTSKNTACYGRFNQAFPFYLKKPIQKLNSQENVKEFFRKNPDGYLISTAQFSDELKNLQLKEIFIKKDLFEAPVTIVYQLNSSANNP